MRGLIDLFDDELARAAAPGALRAALAAQDGAGDEAALDGLAAAIEGVLRGAPGAARALVAMAREERVGRAAAFVAGQALLYLADEADLLPEERLGVLGLVDDAYLLHRCVARLAAAAGAAPDGYVPPDERGMAATRALLPAGMAGALDRTAETMTQVALALFASPAAGAPGAGEEAPALRVRQAAGALA